MRLLFIALFLCAFALSVFAPLSDSCPANRPYCLTSSEAVSQGCSGGSPQCEYSPQGYPQYCYSCPATSTINIDARTECPNVWVIKVTDASTGSPVSRASVIATGSGPSLYGTTNSNGEVRFTGATPGNYYVSVSPPSPYQYKSTSLTYSECSGEISIDTQLQCNDNVKVTVKSNANNQPIGNALVYLYNSNNELISSDTTDSYGEAFVGPATDKQAFYIEVIPSSPYNKKKEQKTFSYSAECLIDINIYPSCDRSVAITLTNNKTLQPIANAEVTLTRTDRFVIGKTLTTDENGQVVYNNVDEGTYLIAAYHPYVGTKTTTTTIAFSDCRDGSITGYYCNGLVITFTDKDGKPVVGSITVYNASDTAYSRPIASATTDSAGYTNVDASHGRYYISGYSSPNIFAKTVIDGTTNSCPEKTPRIESSFTCPDTIVITVYDKDDRPITNTTVTLTGSEPTRSATTNQDGKVSFDNISNGGYYVSTPYGSKTITVDKSECVGCSDSSVCRDNEFCNFATYECTKVPEEECGYTKDHQWINYECCKDSDCKTGYKCDNHVCKERKYDIVVPSQTNVSDNVPIKAYEDGKPCSNCEISIESPDGNKTRVTTNENGEATFFATYRGNYRLNLLSGGSVVASKVSTASVEIGAEDPLKKLISLLSDEKVRNWLIVIIVVIILVVLYLKFRKGGEKVKPDNPQ